MRLGPTSDFNPRTPRGVRLLREIIPLDASYFNPRTPRGVRPVSVSLSICAFNFNPRTPRGVRHVQLGSYNAVSNFNPRTPRGVRLSSNSMMSQTTIFQSTHPARGATDGRPAAQSAHADFNPRTPRGVRQQTLPKSREFAWLNLLICTRGRRLSIQKQTRLCSIKLSFMLFGCEPAGEGVSSWTSHATKSKVRLEGRSAYSQSARSSAHSDFPGNKSGDCPVRGP